MTFVDAAQAPPRKTGQIRLHGPEAFAAMHKAGRLAAEALDLMIDLVEPGVTTAKLDAVAHEFAMDNNAYPAPLGYRGYPKSICTSINHVVCHGIPDDKPLRNGDIINIDVTLIVDGWHGDSSR
ncbi:MAG: M24 family metallopeptidase, partial [Hyphomicrobiales bacterium]|nr:M24 family metallopeptidase [Hyphomicrobiales bacterium]